MLKRNVFCVLLLLLTAVSGWSQNQGEEEYVLKAAFLYNFTKYISWGPFINDNTFTIGILGDSPIDAPLQEIAKTRTVNDKKIIVMHFANTEQMAFCNVLYISKSASMPLAAILNKVTVGTLTISETEGYAQQGTAFNFIIENAKLKFEANVRSINQAGLKASAQLLKLAKIVE